VIRATLLNLVSLYLSHCAILISLCIYSFVKLHVCSLGELVKHDQNGLVFNTESELEQQLEVINKHYRSSVLYTLHGLHVNVLPIYFSLS